MPPPKRDLAVPAAAPERPVLETRLGALHRGDALAWMAALPERRARLVVADPPYNIGKASWDSFGSERDYLLWSRSWIGLARRLLTPDGTLYVCGFPEPLARIAAEVYDLFHSYRWLVWHYRNKGNMGQDWGRSHEALLHLRAGPRMVFNPDDVRVPYNQHTLRYPERPQGASSQYGGGRQRSGRWEPHPLGAKPRDVIEVPTLTNGSPEKTAHPAQKPIELIRRLVLASSRRGDLVVDPFGGSGTTYAVCEETARRWLGCERDAAYCRLIRSRLRAPERFRALSEGETPARRAQRRALLRGPA